MEKDQWIRAAESFLAERLGKGGYLSAHRDALTYRLEHSRRVSVIGRQIALAEGLAGDLVFFEKTMGSNVRGITHVGIYVGNSMMIHAGDPVGFADLKSEQWASRIYGFGRLPID